MELPQALKRIGATIVAAKKKAAVPDSTVVAMETLYLRVDENKGPVWVDAITGFLLSAEKHKKDYQADISKYFFVKNDTVLYYWRAVLTGDVEKARATFAAAVMEAMMAHAKQLDSIPLVGRLNYEFNPLKGKLKGGHDLDTAQATLAMVLAGATT